jgi:hypothetical protein
MIKAIVGKPAAGKTTRLLEEDLDVLFDAEGSKRLLADGAIQVPVGQNEQPLDYVFKTVGSTLETLSAIPNNCLMRKYVVGIDSVFLLEKSIKSVIKRVREFQETIRMLMDFEVDFIVTYQMSREGNIFADGVDFIEVVRDARSGS